MNDITPTETKSVHALGLDLGGTVIKFGIVDDSGQVAFEGRIPSLGRRSSRKIRDQITEAVDRCREEARLQGFSIESAGMGTPGTVDEDGCVRGELPNLPQWRGFPVVAFLREVIGKPVIVENDANLMTFAEARTGSGTGFNTVFGVTFGTGIGGGFVLDGDVYTGTGGAGEIGHTTVVPHGRPCGCGRSGCLERYASVSAMEEIFHGTIGEREPIRNIVDRWIAGERIATDIMEDFLGFSSLGIINMLQILRPECVVIGGGLMEVDDRIFHALERRLDDSVPESFRNTVTIRKAARGNRAGVVGAGLYALLHGNRRNDAVRR